MDNDERDVKAIFNDSAEIAGQLQRIANSLDGYNHPACYWLKEASVHIDGLYADACAMQRTIKRLRLELAAARKGA